MNENKLIKLMEKSIEIASKSISEKDKISPNVGAVLANLEGDIIEEAFRGETGEGNHCEYEIIKKAQNKNIELSNTVLFVTLEPCIVRGNNKIPCTQLIVNSGIRNIYIGMLDPNPLICGKGEIYLRLQDLAVNRYPSDLVKAIMNDNKAFINQYS